MKGAIDKANELLNTIPRAWASQQFSNPENPKSHYLTTGPEIWQQLDERVDALVAGVGTGGTFSGTTRFLKEHNPKMLAFAVEPAQSFVLRGGNAAPHNIAGISPGFIPANFDKSLCDGIIPIDEVNANDVIRQLLLKEGLNVNISSAANIAAAMHLAAQSQFENKNIVTFICDNAQVDQRIQKIQQFYGKQS
jgi:cysteine synthase A